MRTGPSAPAGKISTALPKNIAEPGASIRSSIRYLLTVRKLRTSSSTNGPPFDTRSAEVNMFSGFGTRLARACTVVMASAP